MRKEAEVEMGADTAPELLVVGAGKLFLMVIQKHSELLVALLNLI